MKRIIVITCFLACSDLSFAQSSYGFGFQFTKEDSLRLSYCSCDSIIPSKHLPNAEVCSSIGRAFNGEGFWRLFNANRQETKCGYFERYKLMYGLSYFYDNKKLIGVNKHFNGEYAGPCRVTLPAVAVNSNYTYDSLFIAQVKKYSFKEFGIALKGDFYTKWKANEDPYYILFVSKADSIQCAPNSVSGKYPLIYCKNPYEAESRSLVWKEKGFHTFTYKTFANSSTELNSHFLSYTNEGKCFIIFHELLHNYIEQEKINIPYDIHEALGDVVGNYGALKYARVTLRTSLLTTYKQVALNEKIYECLNGYIEQINKSPQNVTALNSGCYNEVQELLVEGDDFQKERFANGFNNAFLLKNSNYCRNYFLLKRVLLKQGSIIKLLAIIKTLPKNPVDCIKYLEDFAQPY